MAGSFSNNLLASTGGLHTAANSCMRIVFLGTGDIGLPTLRFLLAESRHDLVAVVTQPDKPVGRRQTLTPPAVKTLALAHSVPVFQPERIRHFVEPLRELQADVFVVIAYGQILPQSVLNVPSVACLNLHASLLPKYRGASPIQAAVLAGDSETGMTVMHMDAGLDTGDILRMERILIPSTMTGGQLHDQLAELGPVALAPALDLLQQGTAPRIPQDATLATHTKKLTREDGLLDWSQPAQAIERRILAFDPWPGTSAILTTQEGAKSLKIFPSVHVLKEFGGHPGELLAAGPDTLKIACGNGALEVSSLQLEGKRRMNVREFLQGHPLRTGMRLTSPVTTKSP